jgi:hypothetical protein
MQQVMKGLGLIGLGQLSLLQLALQPLISLVHHTGNGQASGYPLGLADSLRWFQGGVSRVLTITPSTTPSWPRVKSTVGPAAPWPSDRPGLAGSYQLDRKKHLCALCNHAAPF